MADAGVSPLFKALVDLQADLEPVDKTATNPYFKSAYADFPTIKSVTQPLLAKHRLAVTQWPTTLEGQPALRTRVQHESGEYDEDVMLLQLTKADPQAQGSAITYAKRYAYMAALGIVADEDDDGNAAAKVSQTAPRTAAPSGQSSDVLARAKKKIFEELNRQGYTSPVVQKATITKILGHSTIDNLVEADLVMDALEAETSS